MAFTTVQENQIVMWAVCMQVHVHVCESIMYECMHVHVMLVILP